MNGKLIISLDFELMWGVRDKRSIDNYGENIIGVHRLIPELIDIFEAYDVKVTFAIVGFLFFKSKREFLFNQPNNKPNYDDSNLNPYQINYLSELYEEDLYHFAPNLIDLILTSNKHELGSHTFSHYYCLEPGQDIEAFKSDLSKFSDIANDRGIEIESIVFPRNQINYDYLDLCSDFGIKCFRGNQKSWLYSPRNGKEESILRRVLRLLDSYVNLTGHHTYSIVGDSLKYPINLPASRFLRPWNKVFWFLEYFKLRRIKNSMTYAAKNNQVFHLWWHPHNFGSNRAENLAQLKIILRHFSMLKTKYNFKSETMKSIINNL